MYAMFISMTAKPECADALFDSVTDVAAKARTEDGCLVFEPFRPADGSPEVMIFERWTDKAAMEAHMQHEYMRDNMARLPDLLAGEPKIVDAIGVAS